MKKAGEGEKGWEPCKHLFSNCCVLNFEMDTSLEVCPITQVIPPLLGTMPWLVLLHRNFSTTLVRQSAGSAGRDGHGTGILDKCGVAIGNAASF